MVQVVALDHFRHLFGRGETVVVDADHRQHFRDVADEVLVTLVERLQIFERDHLFHVAAAGLDPLERTFRADVEEDDQVRLAHEVAHVAKERQVGAVVALFHQPGVGQHLGEDRVFVDGTVLHRRAAPPDDLLVLLETPVQEVDLGGEGVTTGVAVEVFEVFVVGDRLVVDVDPEVLAERGGEGGLAGTDHAGDTDEEILENGHSALR